MVGVPLAPHQCHTALYTLGVDLYIAGHEHIYERMWPVYDTKVEMCAYVTNTGHFGGHFR